MTAHQAQGASYFAIAIGINEYQSFQTLNYAQHDAQALSEFLVSEAGFPADHCLLLTDSSPEVQGRSTYPTKAAIQDWLTEWCQQRVAPGDVLWCFFCGYGVCFQGQDYLMPADANLADIPGTGIPLNWLYGILQATVGDTAFVILDMNRSSGVQSRGLTGTETINLARTTGVPTLLSCQPGEFSNESPTLRQGFFTSVLLEGLRYSDCTSLDALAQYLAQHLPQLKGHHHQPVQHPVAFGMAAAILPNSIGDLNEPLDLNGRVTAPFHRSQVTQLGNGTAVVGTVAVLEPPAVGSAVSANGETAMPSGIYTSLLNQLVGNPKFSQPPSSDAAPGSTGWRDEKGESAQRTTDFPDSRFPGLQRGNSALKGPAMVSPNGQSAVNGVGLPATEESELEDGTFWRRLLLWGGGITALLLLGTLLRNGAVFWGQSAPLPTAATTPGAVNQPAPSQPQVPPLVTRQTQPGNPPTAVPLTINSPQNTAQLPLAQARKTLTANQASRFSDAIRAARRVRPGDALYPQARQDIERWSRVILDMAEGRAVSGQYAEAIATAALVPRDSATFAKAQTAIANWRTQNSPRPVVPVGNGDLLTQAVSLVRIESASSFSDAIGLAKKIPASDRQYAQAQQLISEWSQMILMIARSRADRGNVRQAIEAARLVPRDTAAYNQAQQAIQGWNR